MAGRSNLLLKAFDPVLGWMARRYQAAVAKELKNYGLRYEDLYDPEMNLVPPIIRPPNLPLPQTVNSTSILQTFLHAVVTMSHLVVHASIVIASPV